MNDPLQTIAETSGTPREASERLKLESFPHVDGPHVTFAYQGPADQVFLRHWVYGLPSQLSFKPWPHHLWSCQLDLPHGSRIEYKIGVVQDGRESWILDPLNPRMARDPFGCNSVVHATGYVVPDWTRLHPEVPTGTLQQLEIPSHVFGEARQVGIHVPHGFNPRRRYRLLIVHDGDDFLRYAQLAVVLDNLVHRLEIPPILTVFTTSPDREREYPAGEEHVAFVVDELIPAVASEFPLIDDAAARCLMGASFGAVAALRVAWHRPEVFNQLLMLSGSFMFTDIGTHARGELFGPVVRFVNAFRANPGRPTRRAYVSCGVYESLIYENRSLIPFLQQQGIEVRYEEARDGHNWENWRDRMRSALTWLFPGPLWLTYE